MWIGSWRIERAEEGGRAKERQMENAQGENLPGDLAVTFRKSVGKLAGKEKCLAIRGEL